VAIMREPSNHDGSGDRRSTAARGPDGRGTRRDDALEDLVASMLEASPEERARLLASMDGEDALRARHVRSRLALLGEFGLSIDTPRRATNVPDRFGPFRRLERVGIGGMGEVYLARREGSDELAAIKLVRFDQSWFETARERFQREIAATAQLSHDGIVRVLEVGEERGVPWLAMEWVGGASLEQVLDRLRGVPPESLRAADFEAAVRAAAAERLHPEAARDGAFPGKSYIDVVTRIVTRVARALAHAHEAGVLHRDVKPSNILVTPSGRVLLADFGLALPRGADRMTRTGAWLGSLPYAAPEQIEGSPRALDPRADVYSLGATLYELVTLRTPFLGGPESSVRRRITTGDLEAPRRLNSAFAADLERICLSALDPDPRRRPQSAAEMAADLERALAGRRVFARAAPIWLRMERWARRRPARAAAVAAATLIVIGSIGIAWRESALAAQLTRLADLELVRGLNEESREFWPAAQERIAPMTVWLARAEALLARRDAHRREFDDLTARALPYAEADRERDCASTREDLAVLAHELDGLAAFVAHGDRTAPPLPPDPDVVRERDAANAALAARGLDVLLASLRARTQDLRRVMQSDPHHWRPDIQQLDDFERILDRSAARRSQRTTFRFADSLDAWRHDALQRLLLDLDQLAEIVSTVRAQLAETRELARLASGEGAAAWERTRAAIAASPLYGGLSIEPVFGLLPLGEDPSTHLFEFLLAESGSAPVRAATAPGRWIIDEASGIVLVLLPGGRFSMGQREGELPSSIAARPVHTIELAPFFISKYEVTVAQAERLGGFPPEKIRPADGRLPLILDWDRSRAFLLRCGLELPTEAQWEYAARANEEGPKSLLGYANVLDRSHLTAARDEGALQFLSSEPFGRRTPADFDDGFVAAAPVGSFEPNAFGLHDTLGNVSEWCLDYYISRGYSTLAARTGDGLRATIVSAQLRCVRGGSFVEGPGLCQPSSRLNESPSKMPNTIGVRPVRPLTKTKE
jgi:serine/threonine protein kinase/formylglycine-generating enzyme required for sulfatase activity